MHGFICMDLSAWIYPYRSTRGVVDFPGRMNRLRVGGIWLDQKIDIFRDARLRVGRHSRTHPRSDT
jgi:hypothetical protein